MAGSQQVKDDPKNLISFKGEFSFVNKDASNIDSKDHNTTVSWHVMNRYERFKKQEQERHLRSSSNNLFNSRSTQSSQPGLNASVRRRRAADALNAFQNVEADIFSQQHERLDLPPNQQSSISGDPTRSGGQALTPSIWNVSNDHLPGATTSSPLSSTIVLGDHDLPALNTNSSSLDLPGVALFDPGSFSSSNPFVTQLISHAYDFIVPEAWPNDNGQLQGTYELSRSWEDITAMSQDSCYANAFLSFLCVTLANRSEDDNIAYQARYFQSQAIIDLRVRLSEHRYDIFTLKAMLKLFCCETVVDNTASARVHLKMLGNIVTNNGGILLLNPWLRENLLSCDCYFALKYETRPLFPASDWTPGPLSQPWKTRLIAAGIMGERIATIHEAVHNTLLKSVMMDLREVFRVEDYCNRFHVPNDDQLLRWKQLRRFDCLNRVATHRLEVSLYRHLFPDPTTQAYTCVAITLMAAMVLGSPEPVRSGLKLIKDLKRMMIEAREGNDMSETLQHISHDARDQLQLWVLYVGMLAEQTHPVQSDQIWFTNEYENLTRELGLDNSNRVNTILQQFLFSNSLDREVKEKRPHRTVESRPGWYEVCGLSWREPGLPIASMFEQTLLNEGEGTEPGK